jgi:polyisoprenoid-binding protein YceI
MRLRSFYSSIKLVTVLIYLVTTGCDEAVQNLSDVNISVTETNNNYDAQKYIDKDYLMDDQHSYVGFKIKYFGHSPVRGRFNNFDGTLFYDPESPESLSASVFIDVNSINTGNMRRDSDLINEDTWFDEPTFPKISFSSLEAVLRPEGGFNLIGHLTMRGITLKDTIIFQKPTTLSRDWAGNEQVDFSGTLVIDRQDFGVFGGDFWSSIMEDGLTQLSDKVEIELEIHCRRPDYQVRYEEADSTDLVKQVLDVISDLGIEHGLIRIDELHKGESLSAGNISSIGYTLLNWGQYDHALAVFNKRLFYFPEKTSTGNQLGITQLFLGNIEVARGHFQAVLDKNPNDSRAVEYLRLSSRIEQGLDPAE